MRLAEVTWDYMRLHLGTSCYIRSHGVKWDRLLFKGGQLRSNEVTGGRLRSCEVLWGHTSSAAEVPLGWLRSQEVLWVQLRLFEFNLGCIISAKITRGMLRSQKGCCCLMRMAKELRSHKVGWGLLRVNEITSFHLMLHEVTRDHKRSHKVGWGHMKSNYWRML